jgi:MarR family transcriptional regulator for hemolysin
MANIPRSAALMKFGMALPKLQRTYRAAADKVVAPVGVSQALAFPLAMLGRLAGAGDVRQSTLADALGIEAPSLARSLDQLVDAGLAERRDDPADRRAKTLHLTAAGNAARDQIEARLHDMRAALFDGISDDDIHACLRVFAQLGQRLGSAMPEMPSSK